LESRVEKTVLDNGMVVILEEDHSAPVAALQVWVGVGSADEREAEGGLAHVHEHMLFKGTERRGVGEIAAAIEGAGGEINAWTSFDHTVYHVVVASRYFDVGLDVLADALLHSAFDPEELNKELQVILEEIKRSEDSPARKVSRALFEKAYTTHPYRRPVIGHAKVVREFTRDQILEFYKTHYQPDRMTVVAVGDFDARQTLEQIQKAFGARQDKARPMPDRPSEPPQTGLRVQGLTDSVEESRVAVAFPIPDLSNDDVFALDVLAVILGQGESSRLIQAVRNDAQLVNDIYAYPYVPRNPGLFVVGASLHHDHFEDALVAIGREIQRIQREPVSSRELGKARTVLEAEDIYHRETIQGRAQRLGYWESLTGDPGFSARYLEGIRRVNADDLHRVARQYLNLDRLTFTALVPEKEKGLVEPDGLEALAKKAFGGLGQLRTPHKGKVGDKTQFHLDGGGRLVVVRNHTRPIVAMRLAWLGGVRCEEKSQAGFSNLLSELVPRGSDRHNARELAELVEGMAGSFSGLSGRNSLGFRARFLTSAFDDGVALMEEVLREPAFDGRELGKVKKLILEDLRNKADDPAGLCYELLARSLWDRHPYRRDLMGTPQTIQSVTADSLRRFWHQQFPPENAVLTIVGDIDIDHAQEVARRIMAPTGSDLKPEFHAKSEDPPPSGRVARLVVDREQAQIMLGTRGLRLDDPDRFALEVLNGVLSGQGGRLFLELRDRQSLCYSVGSFHIEGIEEGVFSLYMGTSPDKVNQALRGMENLLDEVLQKGITQEELIKAQRHLVGVHDIGLQRLSSQAASTTFNVLYGLGYRADEAYAENIEAVDLDAVRTVAEKLLAPEKRILALVGPEGTQGPAATHRPDGIDIDEETGRLASKDAAQ
jgi:zinc protease